MKTFQVSGYEVQMTESIGERIFHIVLRGRKELTPEEWRNIFSSVGNYFIQEWWDVDEDIHNIYRVVDETGNLIPFSPDNDDEEDEWKLG